MRGEGGVSGDGYYVARTGEGALSVLPSLSRWLAILSEVPQNYKLGLDGFMGTALAIHGQTDKNW